MLFEEKNTYLYLEINENFSTKYLNTDFYRQPPYYISLIIIRVLCLCNGLYGNPETFVLLRKFKPRILITIFFIKFNRHWCITHKLHKIYGKNTKYINIE